MSLPSAENHSVAPAQSGAPWSVLVREPLPAGLTLEQLRGSGWKQLSRGLHARPERQSLPILAAAMGQLLPRDSGFGHLTSAALRGWWMPNQLSEHVWLGTTRSSVHVQRRGLYVRRSRRVEFETVAGVVCVTAEQTLLELARDLSFIDLVPMLDRALNQGVPTERIRLAASAHVRGSVVLRRALPLADYRSESWWETMLRLQHTTVGLGPVASQVDIHDGPRFVARADLHLLGTHRYPECDGGGHRDRDQHISDLRRDKDLQRLGAERYGYTTAEITTQPELVIRDAEDARGLAHDPARVEVWRRLAAPSTLTGHGRARLRSRLRRYALASRR